MHKIGRAKIYFILVLAIFLHLTILDHIKIFGARPDIVLICVIFFGFFLGPAAGLETGLASGALEDIFALDYFGINMFVLAAIGLLAGSLSVKFSKESKRSRAMLVFVLAACSMALHFMLASAFSQSLNLRLAEYLATSVLPASLYTSLVSIPIFLKLMGMYALSGQEEYI